MSFLQRPPLDVEIGASQADIFPADHIYDETTHLLRASTTLRPLTGLILRDALTPDEHKTLTTTPIDSLAEATQSLAFLKPVNEAMRDWWQQDRRNRYADITDLAYFSKRDGYPLPGHIDQVVRSSGIPRQGPLTGFLGIHGSTLYKLAVINKDPFRPQHHMFYKTYKGDPLGRQTEAVTSTGDVLLITQAPPTWHEPHPTQDRVMAIFSCHFEPTKVVQ